VTSCQSCSWRIATAITSSTGTTATTIAPATAKMLDLSASDLVKEYQLQ
jgi:hypothetical protein